MPTLRRGARHRYINDRGDGDVITKRLVVKNGSYQKGGEEKTRWLQIGAVHEHEGREYITLDRHINLGALPTREGDTRVFVSIFDEDGQKDAAPARQAKKPAGGFAKDDFGDEIPF